MRIQRSSSIRRRLKIVILILTIISLMAVISYLVWRLYFQAKTDYKTQIIQQVAKSTTLGDKPDSIHQLTEDSIKNQNLIKDQGAQTGDWLLIYRIKQKAVIWRPEENRIWSVIDTLRGDGLDLSDKMRIAIFYQSGFQESAESTRETIMRVWPELQGKVELVETKNAYPSSFIVQNDDGASMSNDIIALTEVLKLPIGSNDMLQNLKPDQTSQIIIYLKD